MRETTTMKFLTPLIVLGVLLVGKASAADVKIIANPSVTVSEISVADLKLIFLETKTSLGAAHVEPVLVEAGAAHAEFLAKYIGRTDEGLRIYYRSLMFTGKGSIPKSFPTTAAAVAYVSKTKGAIAYVEESEATQGVKEIRVK